MHRVLSLALAILLGSIPLLVASSCVTAAEFRLLTSAAIKLALNELVPRFESVSGHKVLLQYDTSAGVRKRIDAGEPFDVSVTTIAATDELIKSGRLLPDPRPVVGVAVTSLAYRTDAPKPDITTQEAFKAILLGATAISVSDPALGGVSSTYFMSILKRLGIETAIQSKLILTKPAEGAIPVGTGAAQYGVALSSEIVDIPGVGSVPIFPTDPASTITLAAAVSAKAAQPEVARSFIDFLLSPDAVSVRKAKGLVSD